MNKDRVWTEDKQNSKLVEKFVLIMCSSNGRKTLHCCYKRDGHFQRSWDKTADCMWLKMAVNSSCCEMCVVWQTFVLLSMYRRILALISLKCLFLEEWSDFLLTCLRNSISEKPPKYVTSLGHSSSEDFLRMSSLLFILLTSLALMFIYIRTWTNYYGVNSSIHIYAKSLVSLAFIIM
jgi:hypothetical protein